MTAIKLIEQAQKDLNEVLDKAKDNLKNCLSMLNEGLEITKSGIPEFKCYTNSFLWCILYNESHVKVNIEHGDFYEIRTESESFGSYDIRDGVISDASPKNSVSFSSVALLEKFIKNYEGYTLIEICLSGEGVKNKYYLFSDGDLYTRFAEHNDSNIQTITIREFDGDTKVKLLSHEGYLYWCN